MNIDDYDGQMIFRDFVSLKLPDICLTGEEKHQKNLTQETCPNRGSNQDPLRDRCPCYHPSPQWRTNPYVFANIAHELQKH